MPKKIDTSFENFAKVATELKLDLYEVSLLLKFVGFSQSRNRKKEDTYQKYKEYIFPKLSDSARQVFENLMEMNEAPTEKVEKFTKILVKWEKESKKR